jgi:hypothetical protein
MSTSRRIIPVTLDDLTSDRRVISGTSLRIPDANQQLDLYYGTQNIFRATILEGAVATAFNPVSPCTWMFGIDYVAFSDNPDYVVTFDADFNLIDDWSELNEPAGKICWRANLATTELKAGLKLHAGNRVLMYANLWMLTADGNVVWSWPVYVNKVHVDPTTAVQVDGITHLTTEAAAAQYVPIWGDQARWKWTGTGWKYLFSDNYWRELTPTLVDGNPVIAWGNPEANT